MGAEDSSESDSAKRSNNIPTYKASLHPNLLLVTSSDDGTVRLFDAVSGRFLRKLISLDSGANGAVVWRICVKNNRLVCAAGSRNYLLDTQIMMVDFNDRRKYL